MRQSLFLLIFPGINHLLVQVKNPEKYGFDPKQLLSQLIDIYLHLKGEVLARAVAEDQRSYNKELFNMCIRLLEKNGITRPVGHGMAFPLASYVFLSP